MFGSVDSHEGIDRTGLRKSFADGAVLREAATPPMRSGYVAFSTHPSCGTRSEGQACSERPASLGGDARAGPAVDEPTPFRRNLREYLGASGDPPLERKWRAPMLSNGREEYLEQVPTSDMDRQLDYWTTVSDEDIDLWGVYSLKDLRPLYDSLPVT